MKLVVKDVGGDGASRVLFLDGWRGLAIALVLIGHFLPIPGSDAGRAGVELFFLLSGLLMGRLLIEKRVPLKRFFFRRVGRVLPGLFAFVSIATLLQFLLPHTFGAFDAQDTGSVLLFFSNYWFLDSHPGIFGHTWSLSIEEHSYLFLGFAAFASRRRPNVVSIITAVSVLLMWTWGLSLDWSGGDYHQVYWRSDVRGASILLGFLLYLNRKPLEDLIGRSRVSLPALQALLLSIALPLLLIRLVPSPLKYTLGTLACGLFLLSLHYVTDGRVLGVLESPGLRWLGRYSYSIYLFQQILHVWKTEFPAPTWPILGCVAVGIGRASYSLVERPGQSVVDRVTAKLE